jgi:hypothetical protein
MEFHGIPWKIQWIDGTIFTRESAQLFNQRVVFRVPVGANFFPYFVLFFDIQMFFYTIMNIFITLPENLNKSCISAGSLSLNVHNYICAVSRHHSTVGQVSVLHFIENKSSNFWRVSE